MRTDKDFTQEVFKRAHAYTVKRRRIITACTASCLIVAVCAGAYITTLKNDNIKNDLTGIYATDNAAAEQDGSSTALGELTADTQDIASENDSYEGIAMNKDPAATENNGTYVDGVVLEITLDKVASASLDGDLADRMSEALEDAIDGSESTEEADYSSFETMCDSKDNICKIAFLSDRNEVYYLYDNILFYENDSAIYHITDQSAKNILDIARER